MRVQRYRSTHDPRSLVDLLDKVDHREREAQPRPQRRGACEVIARRLGIPRMSEREVRGVWSRMPIGQDDFSEALERGGAADARQQDAVSGETLRGPELQCDGFGLGMREPLVQIGKADAVQLILAAQRHVRRDESTLHRIHDAPDCLEVGAALGRYEEAELVPDAHGREGGVGWMGALSA